jgi:hypothetical protein
MSERLGATPARGGPPVGGAPGPRRWHTRVSCYRCSGPPNSTRFSPTAPWRREEPTLLTLGGRRATMAAGVGGAARRKLDVDGSEL